MLTRSVSPNHFKHHLLELRQHNNGLASVKNVLVLTLVRFSLTYIIRGKARQFQNQHAFHRSESVLILSQLQQTSMKSFAIVSILNLSAKSFGKEPSKIGFIQKNLARSECIILPHLDQTSTHQKCMTLAKGSIVYPMKRNMHSLQNVELILISNIEFSKIVE